MPKRRPTKRRSTPSPKSKRGKTRPKSKKKKRSAAAKRRARSLAAKKGWAKRRARSLAAKKGWAKRRKKQRLIDAMHASNWREVALPTRDELYDYMTWLADRFGIEISDMYRLYFGYEVGEAMAAE